MGRSDALATIWPLRGLRLRTAQLRLQVMTEADLATLCALLPDDVGQDPAATRYAALDDRANRSAVLVQSYWRAMGTWSPLEWKLPFVVRLRGEVVGVQWLEGSAFPTRRTVDSASWLVPAVRGRGVGRQMRQAVLALAFGPLGARAAVSSAVLGNAASLGVSHALGYRDVGTAPLGDGPEVLQLLRLERSDWLARRAGEGVAVEGAEVCLPLFGLGSA
ncbi:MAG TPA: GNAT family protein [Intrasporangium sp.]|uniref:GNAT family N-acetyltransferase n=1 Tax=Intrasporangium sp. TaxID=1925024 RepID=UPI002D7A0E55|nr:GNAT family protein [Intrasporangium sp.]HET7399228.1 GNAT family protein [Intrasporangium sp.]